MRSKRLIIFEGPDGGGKTTAIEQLKKRFTDAHVVHHGPYSYVKHDLPRLYQESMMPAVLGHRLTILDRSWLSERPYGVAYRNGVDRIGRVNQRHLERLALRCNAVVVLCLPPWETVKANYLKRRSEEYLKNEHQLASVYEQYERLSEIADLPVMSYDYTTGAGLQLMMQESDARCHSLEMNSGGSLAAKILLVGDAFGNKRDGDPLGQWPFSSFHKMGCSRWLTEQLIDQGIRENELCWVNASELTPTNVSDIVMGKHVIALGTKAADRLDALHVGYASVNHPQFHKRFHLREDYPLIQEIITHLY